MGSRLRDPVRAATAICRGDTWLLVAAAMGLCFGTAIWLDSRGERIFYTNRLFSSGPRS